MRRLFLEVILQQPWDVNMKLEATIVYTDNTATISLATRERAG